jgi:hypothetical protein
MMAADVSPVLLTGNPAALAQVCSGSLRQEDTQEIVRQAAQRMQEEYVLPEAGRRATDLLRAPSGKS